MPVNNGLDSDGSNERARDLSFSRRKPTPLVATSLKELCDCAVAGLRQVEESGSARSPSQRCWIAFISEMPFARFAWPRMSGATR